MMEIIFEQGLLELLLFSLLDQPKSINFESLLTKIDFYAFLLIFNSKFLKSPKSLLTFSDKKHFFLIGRVVVYVFYSILQNNFEELFKSAILILISGSLYRKYPRL